jgi:hypothetical protein
MSYYNQLHPWCIIRCLPNAQTLIITRLRRRNDAEAHLRILQQLTPTAIYQIIFDVAEDSQEASDRIDAQPILSRLTSPSVYPIEPDPALILPNKFSDKANVNLPRSQEDSQCWS